MSRIPKICETRECEEFKAIVSALPDLVFVLTESGLYAGIYGGESTDLYHDGSSLKGLTLFDVLPRDKAQWFLDKIKETLKANKTMVFEYSLEVDDVKNVDNNTGPSGVVRFEGHVNPLSSLRYGERAVVWVARNITKRYKMEQQLIYRSEIDDLSQVLNRRKLFENLKNAFYSFQRYKENYCFLLLDIDNFKQINDSYGHHCGDEVIRNLAKLCQSLIRQSDAVGRLGGDEFGILLKQAEDLSPVAFAERLIEATANTNMICGSQEMRLTISIGLSHFLETDTSNDQVYQRADRALYDAKGRGKKRVSVSFN